MRTVIVCGTDPSIRRDLSIASRNQDRFMGDTGDGRETHALAVSVGAASRRIRGLTWCECMRRQMGRLSRASDADAERLLEARWGDSSCLAGFPIAVSKVAQKRTENRLGNQTGAVRGLSGNFEGTPGIRWPDRDCQDAGDSFPWHPKLREPSAPT